jgi:sarcosine oxidase subunit alpha
MATGTVAGIDARLVRVSFSGELSFEVNVPAEFGGGFLEAILEAGEVFDITPYGIETLMLLRTEKGYLHVGSDTDGSSTPDDVGWGPIARKKATDYIGKRSLFREGNMESGRKQFVGIEPLDPKQTVRPGSHLLIGKDRQAPSESDGWITSAVYSPNLKRHIALGVLKDGREKDGEFLTVCDEDQRFNVKVVSPVFFDPENQRLKG